MNSHKLKIRLVWAAAICATSFYLGCGDDDDNATPSNKGGASSSGGKGGASGEGTGGKSSGGTSSSGGNETTGGTSDNEGGNPGSGGVVARGGSAGEGTGGSAGTGAIGGGGSGSVELPDCQDLNDDGCYPDCTPTSSEQLLNHCSDARTQCTPFDNSTLSKLGANGKLPALPN